MVKIRIPASSANLGSGFDCLGVGLDLYNYVFAEEYDGCKIVSDERVPTDESNLVYQSARRLFEVCGKPFKGLYIEEKSNIPFARGLGSSSACIAGGLFSANELLSRPLKKSELLDLAAELEGHPDNVAPALLGGLTVCVMDEKRVRFVKSELPQSLVFAAFVPDFELKTADARAVLPKEVSLSDAVFNVSRAALAAASLSSGKYENLRAAAEDRLHQPYRLTLISGGEKIISESLKSGALSSFISGSGPTIMAIFEGEKSAVLKNAENILLSTGLNSWKTKILFADNEGAKAL